MCEGEAGEEEGRSRLAARQLGCELKVVSVLETCRPGKDCVASVLLNSPEEELGQLLVEQLVCHIGPVLGQRAVEGGPPRVNGGDNIGRTVQLSHQLVQRVHFIGQVQASEVDFDPGKGR